MAICEYPVESTLLGNPLSFCTTCIPYFLACVGGVNGEGEVACLASVSVRFPARSSHFSLFGGAKIGASATLME